MSTALAFYDGIPDPMGAVKQLGTAIAQSGMFGTTNNAQGEVLALECLTRHMPPLMLAERYHFIGNKLSMKSDVMLAEFHKMGGKHRIVKRDPTEAAIELTFGDDSYLSSITWEQAQGEYFIYEGKEKEIVAQLLAGKKPAIKPKYSTPRSRMQMLWNRAISDGIRAMLPDVNCGVYTPEEVDDFDENQPVSSSRKPAPTKQPAATTTAQSPVAPAVDPNVVDAEIVSATGTIPKPDAATILRIETLLRELDLKPGWDPRTLSPDAAARNLKQLEDERIARMQAGKTPATTTAAVPPVGDACSADQANRIKELWGLLNASPADREKMLASRGAKTARNLTAAQAVELIGKLEANLPAGQQEEAADVGESSEPDPNSNATPEQCAALRQRLIELNQVRPGIAAHVRDMVLAAGYSKLDEVSYGDVAAMLGATYGPAGMAEGPWPTRKEDRTPF